MIPLKNVVVTGYKKNKEDISLRDVFIFVDENNNFKMCNCDGYPISINSLSMANITLKHDIVKFLELISKKIQIFLILFFLLTQ